LVKGFWVKWLVKLPKLVSLPALLNSNLQAQRTSQKTNTSNQKTGSNLLNNAVKAVGTTLGSGNTGSAGTSVTTILNNAGKPMSNLDIVNGLRDALKIGTNNSTSKASALDGFYKNSLIKIPFPPQVQEVKTTLDKLGMKTATDKFVETLNRAAEKAAKDGAPIFINAITSMSITDGISILKGGDNAATKFLKDKTTADLKAKFLPVVKAALTSVQITKYWNPLATKYNKLPLVKKANTNLEEYVTIKAMEGIFKLVEQEEGKIRKDPASRVSDLLKLVFG
jgi:hypothetical protein